MVAVRDSAPGVLPSLFSSLSTVQAPGPSTTLKSMASKNFMDRSRSETW